MGGNSAGVSWEGPAEPSYGSVPWWGRARAFWNVTPHPSWGTVALQPQRRLHPGDERAASQGPRSLTFCVSAWTMGTFLCQMLSMTVLPILPPPLTLPAVSLWFSFVQRVWVRRVNLARFAGQTTATSSPPWLLSNSTSFSQDLPTGTPPPFFPSVSRIGTGRVLLSPPAPGPLFRERSSSQVWHWSPFPCCCF